MVENDDYEFLDDLKGSQEFISDEVWDILDDYGFEFRDLDLHFISERDKMTEMVKEIRTQMEKERIENEG